MDEVLHPSTLSEILDATIRIYRGRFLVFLGIAAVPTAAILAPICALVVLAVWMGATGSGFTQAAGIGLVTTAGLLVVLPVWAVVTALATAAMSHAASRCSVSPNGAAVRGADRIGVRASYKAAWRHGWRYIGLYFLEGLLVWMAPAAVFFALAAFTAGIAAALRSIGLDALLGVFAFVAAAGLAVYAVWMFLRLSLAFAAAVVEEMGAGAAIGRGAALARGTKGRIFLLYLLGSVVNYLLTLAVTVPLSIVLAMIPGINNPQYAQTMAGILLVVVYGAAFAAQALTRPVYAIALVLFYYDQRIRKEGFDIEWMMSRAGLVPPQPAAPKSQPWMPPILGAAESAARPQPVIPTLPIAETVSEPTVEPTSAAGETA